MSPLKAPLLLIFIFEDFRVPVRVPEISEVSAPSIRPSTLTPEPIFTALASLSIGSDCI